MKTYMKFLTENSIH